MDGNHLQSDFGLDLQVGVSGEVVEGSDYIDESQEQTGSGPKHEAGLGPEAVGRRYWLPQPSSHDVRGLCALLERLLPHFEFMETTER